MDRVYKVTARLVKTYAITFPCGGVREFNVDPTEPLPRGFRCPKCSKPPHPMLAKEPVYHDVEIVVPGDAA